MVERGGDSNNQDREIDSAHHVFLPTSANAFLSTNTGNALARQFAIDKVDKIMSCAQRMVNYNPTFLALRLLPV